MSILYLLPSISLTLNRHYPFLAPTCMRAKRHQEYLISTLHQVIRISCNPICVSCPAQELREGLINSRCLKFLCYDVSYKNGPTPLPPQTKLTVKCQTLSHNVTCFISYIFFQKTCQGNRVEYVPRPSKDEDDPKNKKRGTSGVRGRSASRSARSAKSSRSSKSAKSSKSKKSGKKSGKKKKKK